MGIKLSNPAGDFKGMIILWYGLIANIPTGWRLCDGAGGTPDLRNKFIVCANADSGGFAKTTVTGAATQFNDNPLHYHDVSVSIPSGGSISSGMEYSDTATGTSGANIDVALPPYFALAYIMKL